MKASDSNLHEPKVWTFVRWIFAVLLLLKAIMGITISFLCRFKILNEEITDWTEAGGDETHCHSGKEGISRMNNSSSRGGGGGGGGEVLVCEKRPRQWVNRKCLNLRGRGVSLSGGMSSHPVKCSVMTLGTMLSFIQLLPLTHSAWGKRKQTLCTLCVFIAAPGSPTVSQLPYTRCCTPGGRWELNPPVVLPVYSVHLCVGVVSRTCCVNPRGELWV